MLTLIKSYFLGGGGGGFGMLGTPRILGVGGVLGGLDLGELGECD